MKVRKCPGSKFCWDYGNCEGCAVGEMILKYERKIKRHKTKSKN